MAQIPGGSFGWSLMPSSAAFVIAKPIGRSAYGSFLSDNPMRSVPALHTS